MKNVSSLQNTQTVIDNPELRELKVLYYIDMFLLITDFLMPQYFGIDVGFDITCTRFADILIIIYILLNPKIFRIFTKNCFRISISIPLILYLFVALYTMVYRVDINAFMLVFLEIITLYMLFFGVRYVIGIRKSLRIIVFCAYFLSLLGFVDFALGQSLYLKFLRTVPTTVSNVYRSGSYRIMGPCGHPLGYGLLLLLFIPICCIDLDKDEINLLKRPVLILLLFINVFLTGSRSTLVISLLEIVLIVVFSKRDIRKKTIFWGFSFVIVLSFFLLIFQKTAIGTYMLRQITSIIDVVFHTQLSAKYGASVETLENSETYREFLPKIFTLDWLNPFIGRGVKRSFGAEFVTAEGEMVYVQSIDNYYVSQYIKYAYPGMIAYIAFIIVAFIDMLRNTIKQKSGLLAGLTIGFACYFFNLWYLDALQTLKFVYVVVALFFAYVSALKIINKKEDEYVESQCDCSRIQHREVFSKMP